MFPVAVRSELGRRCFPGYDLGDIAGHCDLVPDPEETAMAGLGDVIDPDLLIFKQELCLRSRVDHPSQLQKLAQADGVVPDGHSAHGVDAIGFWARPGRPREVPPCSPESLQPEAPNPGLALAASGGVEPGLTPYRATITTRLRDLRVRSSAGFRAPSSSRRVSIMLGQA